MTPEFVTAHLDKPWDWNGLSLNSSITSEFVMTHIDKPLDWARLSSNNGDQKKRKEQQQRKIELTTLVSCEIFNEDLVRHISIFV